MSTATVAIPASPRSRGRQGPVSIVLRDVAVLTWRNLIHIGREPMQLSDATFQPVIFTLLFIDVLGSAVPVPGGYKEFAVAGLIALNLTTASVGTAVGLAADLSTGVIDRFRTLPMWGAAVLVGRSVADLLTQALAAAIVLLTGLAVGWRPHASAASVLAGAGLALLFTYCLSWACACLGITSKGAESAASIGFIALLPLAIVSNAMVPTQGMPAWVRQVADWNPVSAMTSAIRQRFGNPNPSAAIHAWPMEHPLLATLVWSAAILAVFAPLATYLYRRRTTN
jgi:ABC-2 type transport system permease protein